MSEILRNTRQLTSSIRIALAAMCISMFASPQLFAQDQSADDQADVQDTDILEEVADTVAFLASDESSYLTGVNLDINGGLYYS